MMGVGMKRREDVVCGSQCLEQVRSTYVQVLPQADLYHCVALRSTPSTACD